MKTTTDALDRAVSVARQIDTWDEWPMLYVVSDEVVSMVVLAQDAPLPKALPIFAAQIRAGKFSLTLPEVKVTGIVVSWEGWLVKVDPKKDPVRAAEIMAFRANGGRNEALPEAVEIKQFMAVDAEGEYHLQYERGGEPYAPAEGSTQEGTLIDGVRDLYAALTS